MQNLLVQIGELIDGKLRVEGMLGQGAVGLVLRAKHVLVDVDVQNPFMAASQFHPDHSHTIGDWL